MTLPTKPTVSVVVCAYTEERWDALVAAVASLQTQSIPPQEIVVVIDHNQSLLERAASSIEGITVIPNREQRGLSGARNSGIAAAQGAIIAFMDEDAVAAKDWIEHLVSYYHDPTVFGVGGPVEPMWLRGRPAWFPEEFDWVVGCTYRGSPTATSRVQRLIGCNMSFRREVFAEIDGFRHGMGRVGTIPLAGEETELCIRLRQRWPQSKLIYAPRAKVDHRVPAHRASWSYFRARCYAEGVSKATIIRFVGRKDGLASERSYTLRTLPLGFIRYFTDGLRQIRLSGFMRAGALVAGFSLTVAGYAITLSPLSSAGKVGAALLSFERTNANDRSYPSASGQ